MCVMGLGSDTRGSVRIPAALCGVAGFKPTASRVDRTGAFPLSYTLDSVGPLANSVACCAVFDAILSGEGRASEARPPPARPVRGLRLLVPECFAMADLDDAVDAAFSRALTTLEDAGCDVVRRDAAAALDAAHALYAGGGFAGPESAQIHRPILASHRVEYDPNVAARIEAGENASAADYVHWGWTARG